MEEYVLKEETYQIIGICMEVHRILGQGFSEIVYKDAISIEASAAHIDISREKEYTVCYKGWLLNHNFYADFVMFENIIVEIKASEMG
jgi:GxxExxY protein